MRIIFRLLFLTVCLVSCASWGQTYCSTPITQNTTTNISLTVTPPANSKYYTTLNLASTNAAITAGSRYYAGTSVKLNAPFKATSSTTKFVAAVGPCTTMATKIQEPIDKEETLVGNIVLFPNPTATKFTSVFNEVEVSSLSIYSIEGKQIYFQEHLEGQKELEVEVAQLPEGIYTVMYLTTQGEQIAKKFLKIKG